MPLDAVAGAERVRISFFGKRNAGKSSLVNAITGQDLSVVSPVAGTTTDEVHKAMELLPLGPVVMVDTPGFDDEGDLGTRRVERAKRSLRSCDIAVLVVDGAVGFDGQDARYLQEFIDQSLPFIIVWNKYDLAAAQTNLELFLQTHPQFAPKLCPVSVLQNSGMSTLKEKLAHIEGIQTKSVKRPIADLLKRGDVAVLVCPIDASAPKGRLIMPQQLVIRDLLDGGCIPVICQDSELERSLSLLNAAPALVICDSQVFAKTAAIVPKHIPLTSFSIIMIRYKADLTEMVRGAAALDRLCDGDRILISEGCTHHRQCQDIGSVKLPALIRKYTKKQLEFDFSSGGDFSCAKGRYALVVHCGACMLNTRELAFRIKTAKAAQLPITNYGVAIAYMHGILQRSLSFFSDALSALASD